MRGYILLIDMQNNASNSVIEIFDDARWDLSLYFGDNTTLKVIVVVSVAILAAYVIGKILAKIILKITQAVAVRADEAYSEDRSIKLRRVETYLSVGLAVLRFLIIVIVVLIAISLLIEDAFRPATAIGASTVFFVLGIATLGVLLRDLTAGSTMIAEKWYSVGDFIRVEPFWDVKGVVEQMTLRATKVRAINGDVTWMHHQYVQAVSVTPGGKRTEAIDIFVDDVHQAQKEIEPVLKTLRPGPTMLSSPLHIVETEQLSDKVWRITIVGETAPGREWLLEDFMANALSDAAKQSERFQILYGPMVRYADDAAERRFRRAVRIRNQ